MKYVPHTRTLLCHKCQTVFETDEKERFFCFECMEPKRKTRVVRRFVKYERPLATLADVFAKAGIA